MYDDDQGHREQTEYLLRFVQEGRLDVTVREYREIEAGARTPSFGTWDRISDCSADHRRSRWQAHEEPTRMSEISWRGERQCLTGCGSSSWLCWSW
jgi:hypothetical protein